MAKISLLKAKHVIAFLTLEYAVRILFLALFFTGHGGNPVPP